MHSKKLSRWLKLFIATLGITALFGFALTAPSQAFSPNPTPYCTEGTCWVTFDYTGDNFVWTPPAKINSLHFDVYGAQGGRVGGKGGSVSGDFTVIPSSLYVYVGGMGSSSNSAAGGFNGGGVSGNGHGDQGSGGGASDLRTSTNLSDRVVVAGGGGGTGGWIGGVGGPGGLTIATAGTKGSPSGTAGGGGTQSSGGGAGLGVTTGNGTAGALGVGGTGGSGSVAGGGGGGGGFYGGGGGGSDSVSGGSDGAGGGGGSSFATMALTSSVVHQAGVRSGNGQVVIRYTFAPVVTTFALTSAATTANGKADYQLTFDQLVYDLDPFDFKTSGTAAGCQVGTPTGNGYTFQVSVTNCSSGTLNLSLRPSAVIGATAGPASETLAQGEVTMDGNPPAFTVTAPASPTNSVSPTFVVSSIEPFTKPLSSAFQVEGSGCSLGAITMLTTTSAEIQVLGCQHAANVRLTVLANGIKDLAGNTGPVANLSSADVLIDREAPMITSNHQISTAADLVQFEINFNETVTGLKLDSFTASTGCVPSKLDGEGSHYLLWVSGCQDAASVTLKPHAVSDAAGNLGPATENSAVGNNDTIAPNANFTELPRVDKTLSPSFELRFDELVSGFTIDSLSQSGTAKNCAFTLTEETVARVYRVDSANCSSGTLRISLLSKSVTDSKGNVGPILQVDSQLVKIAEAPVVVHRVNRANLNPLLPPPSAILKNTPTLSSSPQQSAVNEPVTSAAGIRFEEMKPDSWVALAVAMIALLIAKRSRGRRAIRR